MVNTNGPDSRPNTEQTVKSYDYEYELLSMSQSLTDWVSPLVSYSVTD